MRGTWGVILLVAFCASCKKDAKTAVRLYTDAELATMEHALDQLLADNKTRACPRPVLRGDVAPGPADDDLVALAEPTGALEACSKLMRDQGEALNDVLRAPLGAALPASLAAAAETCAGVPAAFRRAAQHEDACSPYLIGRRREGELVPYIALAKAAVLHARELAHTGKAADAIALLLDTAHTSQDFGRGGGIVVVMVGQATAGLVLRAARLILATDVALTAPELDAIDRELAALIASEPHVRTMLTGEADVARLTLALQLIKPADWAPPGGWPEDLPRPTAEDMKPLAARDYGGMMWEVTDRWSAPLLAACGEAATLEACASAPVPDSPGGTVDVASVRAVLDGAKSLVRGPVVDTLAAVATPTFAQLVGDYGWRTVQLVHLRVQVAVRKRLVAGDHCPGPGDAAAPDFAAVLAVPALGAPLTLEETPDGFAVRAPAFLHKKRPVEERLVVCPLRAP